ncbi:hypothetical protein AB0N02_35220, partial [Streptosporangium sp. NPDC051022]
EGPDLPEIRAFFVCSEEPGRHILRITWTSAEDHLRGFRQGPNFAAVFAEIRPYVSAIEEMHHYEPTGIRGPGAADEVGLPADPEFRAAFLGYIEWGTRPALTDSPPGATPIAHAPVPHRGWGWRRRTCQGSERPAVRAISVRV